MEDETLPGFNVKNITGRSQEDQQGKPPCSLLHLPSLVTTSTQLRRLLPSILFAAAVTYASYLFALTWTPPDRANRLMPSQPFSSATILGIIGINTFILLAWRFPPAWNILNRYFILVPAVVRPFSSLGNVFSHQASSHLFLNMLLLWLVGTPLHEQIGRGDFLAIYTASGVLSSVASLSVSVFRNIWITSSMGASGAVIGVVAAYCTINPE
jgi:rhomboid-like protein